jgi:hypothetical protein
MSFRALVVNPWVTDFKLYDEWMHPVGLYFLIAMLKQNGAQVLYVDCLQRPPDALGRANGTGAFPHRPFPKPAIYGTMLRRYKLYGSTESDLCTRLSGIPAPDAVFVGSSMTYWLPGLRETVRVVRSVVPGTPVVIGGTSAQLIPSAVREACPDAFVYGGTLFDQTAIRASNIPYLSSLKSLSACDSLLPALEVLSRAFHGPALSSLGCPLSCSYCASRFLHPGYVPRPAPVVAEELAFLQNRLGVGNFAWYDDALLHNNGEHFLLVARALSRAGVTGAFHTPNGLHVRWATPEVLDGMKSAGFETLRFGYETGGDAFLRDTGGKTSRKGLARAVSAAKQAGFGGASIGVYVMAGLAGQTRDQVEDEMEFVASLSVKTKPVFVSPVPRTPLFERYAAAYPVLRQTPLSHNDSYFITLLPGWDAPAVQQVMDLAKANNASVS